MPPALVLSQGHKIDYLSSEALDPVFNKIRALSPKRSSGIGTVALAAVLYECLFARPQSTRDEPVASRPLDGVRMRSGTQYG